MKSYVKLASGLMFAGMGFAALERMAASGLAQMGFMFPAEWSGLVSALAFAPFVLIAAGALVYLGGAILGLK